MVSRIVLCFVLVAGISCSGAAGDGQERVSSAARKDTIGDAAVPKENWGALEDTKTGLESYTPALVSSDQQAEFVRELVRVQWRVGDPIDLWIVRPKTAGKVPLILYLYSYPLDPQQFRDDGWCKRATADGFAAIGFVSAMTGSRYRMRPMKEWFVSELPEALGSSVHDVELILNYLSSRNDLDMNHVGMFGMGSGGTIAILAASVDPRIKSLDVLDPWGDWPDWMKESPAVPESERERYENEGFLKSVAIFDPINCLPSLKTRNVRVQQTVTDPVTPKSAKDKIAGSVPNQKELVRYANPEEHLKAWQTGGLSGWIKDQLNAPPALISNSQ